MRVMNAGRGNFAAPRILYYTFSTSVKNFSKYFAFSCAVERLFRQRRKRGIFAPETATSVFVDKYFFCRAKRFFRAVKRKESFNVNAFTCAAVFTGLFFLHKFVRPFPLLKFV